jgi:hypothetical protein
MAPMMIDSRAGHGRVMPLPLAWIIHDFASKKRKGALKD